MGNLINIERFLDLRGEIPVLDVRSPDEYNRGHIPGALNLPLFSNEERALVGTFYHKSGRGEAVKEAFQIVRPKLEDIINFTEAIAPDHKVLMYCWRGGMRSASVGFLLETAGFEVLLLEKGYKAYRRFILQSFEEDLPVIVLGGMTGSGKTGILRCLAEMGEQVIDLEGLANHKGSVFGGIGQQAQPTTEQFANDLYIHWQKLDHSKILWLEDESYQIGEVSLPNGIFHKIRESNLLKINMSREMRAKRCSEEYGKESPDELAVAIQKIEKRLGGLKTKQALEALSKNDFYQVAMITLEWYDKAYEFTVKKRPGNKVFSIETDRIEDYDNAAKVLDYCQKIKIKTS